LGAVGLEICRWEKTHALGGRELRWVLRKRAVRGGGLPVAPLAAVACSSHALEVAKQRANDLHSFSVGALFKLELTNHAKPIERRSDGWKPRELNKRYAAKRYRYVFKPN
jgi:hypothetical protein